MQDYDEKYPFSNANNGDPIKANHANWPSEIYAYVKNLQVYRCPDDSSTNGCSYLGNNKLDQVAMAQIPKVSEFVLVDDGSQGGNPGGNTGDDHHMANLATFNGLNADYTIWDSTSRQTDPGNGMPRHSNGMNIMFADSHVKYRGGIQHLYNGGDKPQTARDLQGAVDFPGGVCLGQDGTNCPGTATWNPND